MELRWIIYRHFADTGTAPTREQLNELADGDVDVLLRSLHDDHMIVLDDRSHRRGEIRMALPFSAEPTDYRVTSAGTAWWANCAWDSLAIGAATGADIDIDAHWSDTGDALRLEIRGGELGSDDGRIHFEVPARHWWDDIVET